MPATNNAPFSSSEWTFLSRLLAMVAEQFAYKSSTDFALEASDEHKAIVAAAIERAGVSGNWGDDNATGEDCVAQVMDEDAQIVTFMDWMAEHLAARCATRAAGAAAPASGAELALMAELLDVAREDHDDAEGLGLVPHAIDMTGDNRAVLASISSEDTRPPGQETRVPFKAALIFFGERCAAASS